MWDRLLVDCNIATFEERPGNPLGLIENGAIAIAEGKILRVGKRTELAGFRAKDVVALGGAWVGDWSTDVNEEEKNYVISLESHGRGEDGVTYGPYFDDRFKSLMDFECGGLGDGEMGKVFG
jgi:imidazolonepropionase